MTPAPALPELTSFTASEPCWCWSPPWDTAADEPPALGELPKRLIELYTYEGDVVLDPFMGSGTTAVAALRTDRHYIGFDTDKAYVDRATERIEEETARLRRQASLATVPFRVQLPAVLSADESEDFQERAVREGRQTKDLAGILLDSCGFLSLDPALREACWPRHRGELPGRRPSGARVGLRRFRRVHIEPRWSQAD